jgi:hypothetical protein
VSRVKLAALVSTIVTLGAIAAVEAQDAVHTVTVEVQKGGVITVTGAEALQGGQTRFALKRAAGAPRDPDLNLLALDAGKTVDDFKALLAKRDLFGLFDLGSVDLGTGRAATLALKPGTSYVLAETSNDDPAKWQVISFTTAATTSAAQAPAPAATVRMVDFRFRGDTRLPRRGTVRFANEGQAPHFAIAAPLRKGATNAKLRQAFNSTSERVFERRINRLVQTSRATTPQGDVEAGAVNDQEVRFTKTGRHVLICFFPAGEDGRTHAQLGMWRTVSVR